MIEFTNIRLLINDKLLLNQCTGCVQSGDIIVLTGLSGSGKSLLLQILSSLIQPTQGILTLNGRTLTDIRPMMWRNKVGFIQQQPILVDGDVLTNLQLPFSFAFYKNQTFDKDWCLAQLTRLGKTADFLSQDSQTLSGGERQLVNLLRCLQLNPQYLLLDEPTSALDPVSKQQFEAIVWDWLQQDKQRACLWISHDKQQIDKILVNGGHHWQMQQGKLLC